MKISGNADVIRRMEPGDAEAASRIVTLAVRSGFSGHYAPQVIETVFANNSPQALLDHAPKQIDYVCLRREAVVAMLGLKRNEIGHLFVAPTCAGQGIGRRLVEFALREIRAAGHDQAVVYSSLNAVGFYVRCGFVEENSGSFDLGGGVKLAYVQMHVFNLAG